MFYQIVCGYVCMHVCMYVWSVNDVYNGEVFTPWPVTFIGTKLLLRYTGFSLVKTNSTVGLCVIKLGSERIDCNFSK